MRGRGDTITHSDFAEALASAKRGEFVTDVGAEQELHAALITVAQAAPNPPAHLIESAEAAYRAQARH